MNTLAPPDAEKRPKQLSIHGDVRNDEYYWLRDDERKDPDMLAYLEAENTYFEQRTSQSQPLRETLYQEITSRIKQDDSSVPVKSDDYWYYTRYSEGQDYPVYARKKDTLDNSEQVMLDANELAKPYEYYNISNWEVSDDQNILAYAEDTVSRRQYTVRFKNLTTGEVLTDKLVNTSGALAWSANGQYLFYVRKHEQTLLPYQLWRHKMGTSPDADELIYEEQDSTFYLSMYRGKSKDYIYMHLGSTVSDEVRILPADQPEASFKVFLERERDHEYSVSDVGGRFFVLSNWQAQNFRVMETTLDQTSDRSKWREFIAHRDDVLIHGIEEFNHYLAISERSEGLRKIRVMPLDTELEGFNIESDEAAYTTFIGNNPSIDSHVLRYYYTSMTTPGSVFDYDMKTGERTLLKRDEVVDPNFDPKNYQSERFSVAAEDGAQVPVSVVYRKQSFRANGSSPILVYAYGSYGSSIDPRFSISRLSLLDRGFVFAIAHIRGGQELGRQWYENGKMFNKINTFTDFIDVTKGLVERKYGDPKRVYAMGGSAGGLLMGAIINMAPELYHGVVAAVPFVDVITTMLDESIPLTTGEFDEWGNPKIKAQYDYMKSYSPYDQVKAQAYPNLLVTTGLWDSQVQYWEPAKWVARLRDYATDNTRIMLYTDMESGHGGASGRFKRHADTAREYAFLIELAEPK